jgi:hypothetical protein
MSEDANFDPLSRRGVERLVNDCTLLLDYLSRVPDARLDWCFEETRGRASGTPPARMAAPPAETRSKADFLARLTTIGSQVRDTPASTFPVDSSEIAFLLAARDFLSAIAWPASVETIRVTQSYCAERQRLRQPLWRRAVAWVHSTGPTGPEEDRAVYYGRRIASRRDRYQFMLVSLAAVTIWLSFQTLVGQRLVLEANRFATQWAAHEASLRKAGDEAIPLLRTRHLGEERFLESQPGFQRYCDYRITVNASQLLAVAGGGAGDHSAMGVGDPSRGRTFFLDFNHQRLCDEGEALRYRAAALQASMQRWYGDIGPVVGLLRLPGEVYGIAYEQSCIARAWINRALLDTPANAPRPSCSFLPARGGFREPPPEVAPTATFYVRAVGTEVFTGGMLAQLLPCLYAVLGALASMFRRLGQRVQAEALSISDHGGMRMTVILGVLAGAVIGLFVGQLQTMEGTETLTLAGFALLAGYAVDRLFNLFDSLSSRLFGEPTALVR